MRISLAKRGSIDWARSAPLVKSVFQRQYGAVVNPDPDYFLSYFEYDEEGSEHVLATSAVTLPENDELLVERYLDGPVEQEFARRRGGEPPRRDQILQIGSIASARKTAGAEIIRAFPLLLLCLGRQYGAMTLTKHLMDLMSRLGVVFYPLAQADPSRLTAEEREQWGTYYDHRPTVCIAAVEDQIPLLIGGSGRYRFSSVEMLLLPDRDREPAHAA